MRNNEHQIQKCFVDYISWKHPELYKSISCFAIPNGGARNIITGALLKAEGVRKGVADYFIAKPNKTKHGMFIEFKSLKNKLTPEQKIFMESRIADNYSCVVCYSVASAIEELEKYLAS